MTEKAPLVERETLPYRDRAVAVIYDRYGRVLISQHNSFGSDQWDFLGGGIEAGETPQQTITREFNEEAMRINGSLRPVATATQTPTYEWPDELIAESQAEGRNLFRGQRQHFVLAYYDGSPESLEPNTSEVRKFDWVPTPKLKDLFRFTGQWERTEPAIKEFWDNHIRTGTEFYGLEYGMIETGIESANSNQIHHVLDPARMLRMMTIEKSYGFPEGLIEVPLPRVFNSLHDIRKRLPLNVMDEDHFQDTSRETFANLLAGFDHYISVTQPGMQVLTEIKIYQEYVSGQEIPTKYFLAPAHDNFSSIDRMSRAMQHLTGKNWTGGFSGRVWISPRDDNDFQITSLKERDVPWDIPGTVPYIVPFFDFDTHFTQNQQGEIKKVIEILRQNGFSGWLVSSGRGNHYIGDFLLPYSEFHKTLGFLASLTISSDPEFARNREYAQRIYVANGLPEARDIAVEILDPEIGIPNTDTAVVGDIRWVARSLLRGSPILRAIPYWKNPSYPKVVAKIY